MAKIERLPLFGRVKKNVGPYFSPIHTDSLPSASPTTNRGWGTAGTCCHHPLRAWKKHLSLGRICFGQTKRILQAGSLLLINGVKSPLWKSDEEVDLLGILGDMSLESEAEPAPSESASSIDAEARRRMDLRNPTQGYPFRRSCIWVIITPIYNW